MSLFELIGALAAAVAVFGYINHRFIGLPDTVGITAIGLLLSLVMAIAGSYIPGVVAYLLLLGFVTGVSEPTPPAVGLLLAKEVVGALIVGLGVGYLAFFMLKGVDSYPVEILITIALATGGYAFAERVQVSAPLAVVVMGLVIGNHGARSAMSETTRKHLFAFWELLDSVLNLVLLGLIGIKLLSLVGTADLSWFTAAALLPVVLTARFASVGIPVLALRPWLAPTAHTVKVLTWGGLRGGISVALALSLPPFAGKELFVTATYTIVLFSLLVQSPTLGPLLKRLEIRAP